MSKIPLPNYKLSDIVVRLHVTDSGRRRSERISELASDDDTEDGEIEGSGISQRGGISGRGSSRGGCFTGDHSQHGNFLPSVGSSAPAEENLTLLNESGDYEDIVIDPDQLIPLCIGNKSWPPTGSDEKNLEKVTAAIKSDKNSRDSSVTSDYREATKGDKEALVATPSYEGVIAITGFDNSDGEKATMIHTLQLLIAAIDKKLASRSPMKSSSSNRSNSDGGVSNSQNDGKKKPKKSTMRYSLLAEDADLSRDRFTLLVVNSKSNTRSMRVLFALARGVPIVTEEWVYNCMTLTRWESPLALSGQFNHVRFSRPQNTANVPLAIFNGICFYIAKTSTAEPAVLAALLGSTGATTTPEISKATACLFGNLNDFRSWLKAQSRLKQTDSRYFVRLFQLASKRRLVTLKYICDCIEKEYLVPSDVNTHYLLLPDDVAPVKRYTRSSPERISSTAVSASARGSANCTAATKKTSHSSTKDGAVRDVPSKLKTTATTTTNTSAPIPSNRSQRARDNVDCGTDGDILASAFLKTTSTTVKAKGVPANKRKYADAASTTGAKTTKFIPSAATCAAAALKKTTRTLTRTRASSRSSRHARSSQNSPQPQTHYPFRDYGNHDGAGIDCFDSPANVDAVPTVVPDPVFTKAAKKSFSKKSSSAEAVDSEPVVVEAVRSTRKRRLEVTEKDTAATAATAPPRKSPKQKILSSPGEKEQNGNGRDKSKRETKSKAELIDAKECGDKSDTSSSSSPKVISSLSSSSLKRAPAIGTASPKPPQDIASIALALARDPGNRALMEAMAAALGNAAVASTASSHSPVLQPEQMKRDHKRDGKVVASGASQSSPSHEQGRRRRPALSVINSQLNSQEAGNILLTLSEKRSNKPPSAVTASASDSKAEDNAALCSKAADFPKSSTAKKTPAISFVFEVPETPVESDSESQADIPLSRVRRFSARGTGDHSSAKSSGKPPVSSDVEMIKKKNAPDTTAAAKTVIPSPHGKKRQSAAGSGAVLTAFTTKPKISLSFSPSPAISASSKAKATRALDSDDEIWSPSQSASSPFVKTTVAPVSKGRLTKAFSSSSVSASKSVSSSSLHANKRKRATFSQDSHSGSDEIEDDEEDGENIVPGQSLRSGNISTSKHSRLAAAARLSPSLAAPLTETRRSGTSNVPKSPSY